MSSNSEMYRNAFQDEWSAFHTWHWGVIRVARLTIFVAKLKLQTDHLRPSVATVRCGQRPNIFEVTERLFTAGCCHSLFWPKATTFEKSQVYKNLTTLINNVILISIIIQDIAVIFIKELQYEIIFESMNNVFFINYGDIWATIHHNKARVG